MKTQSADFITRVQPSQPAFFWARCTVDAVFAGGRRLTVEIEEVIGGKFANLHHKFRGKIPTFDYFTDPGAENPLLHHELIIARNTNGFIRVEAGKHTGATMLDGTQVAIFMRYDEEQAEKGNDDLGFTPLYWSSRQEFDYANNEVKRMLAEKLRKQREGEQMAHTYAKRAVRVVYNGTVVATETMADLSAWFQNRAFPKGVEFRANIQGSYRKVDMHILPRQNGVNHPSPKWLERNSIMCELREQIKDKPVYTGEEKEDDSLVSEEFRDRFVDRMARKTPQPERKEREHRPDGKGKKDRGPKGPRHPNRGERRRDKQGGNQQPPQDGLVSIGNAIEEAAKDSSKPVQNAPGSSLTRKLEAGRQRQAALKTGAKNGSSEPAPAPATETTTVTAAA